ncbi:MAG: DUF1501 domain-containing protein [Isosphaeraceae bacterium]
MIDETRIGRRSFLRSTATAAAMGLGAGTGSGIAGYPALAWTAEQNGAGLVAPARTHHQPKADSLVIVFLTGGFSHVDTFDYKPALARYHNRPVPAFGLRPDETHDRPLMASPFRFRPHGESGLMVSELFPNLGAMADRLCVIRSLHTDIVEHFQAVLAMHTGSATVPMPSLGAWLSYGLGTRNPNLPAYVVLCERLPYAGTQVWDSSFLPAVHQGVRIIPGREPIPDLAPAPRPTRLVELERIMLQDVDAAHAARRPGDAAIRARSATFDIARGLMREAPEALDVARESRVTLDAYGIVDDNPASFPRQCLVARRLIERGVRVVELIDSGSNNNWDAHGDMREHRPKAQRVDRAIAAMLRDLDQRGLLGRTLVAICTEFGRTPWTDSPGTKGRNHYAKAFSVLLAGAGVKGGLAYGETDEFGSRIVRDPVHVHDYHATILHLMGVDHTRLVYRYAGRDFRLTDVDGKVVTPVLS